MMHKRPPLPHEVEYRKEQKKHKAQVRKELQALSDKPIKEQDVIDTIMLED